MGVNKGKCFTLKESKGKCFTFQIAFFQLCIAWILVPSGNIAGIAGTKETIAVRNLPAGQGAVGPINYIILF